MEKYWIALELFERHSDAWYWNYISFDNKEEYQDKLNEYCKYSGKTGDGGDIVGLGKLKDKNEAQVKIYEYAKKRAKNQSKSQSKNFSFNGMTIWAIIQTVLTLIFFGKAMEMKGFEAFFAILFGICWLIGWWWAALYNNKNE